MAVIRKFEAEPPLEYVGPKASDAGHAVGILTALDQLRRTPAQGVSRTSPTRRQKQIVLAEAMVRDRVARGELTRQTLTDYHIPGAESEYGDEGEPDKWRE